MLQWMKNLLNKPAPAVEKPVSLYEHFNKFVPSTHKDTHLTLDSIRELQFQRCATQDIKSGETMDSKPMKTMDGMPNINPPFNPVPYALLNWYGGQGFIGYQMCAILSQNWLIRKACEMPAKDAIRKGYTITQNSGDKLDPEVLQAFKDAAVKYKLNSRLCEYITFGRIYGIRVAIFQVDSNDKKYYENPFNIDGVKPGSYRGISMPDPYWVTPLLDFDAVNNPDSQYFYEPTYWVVQGRLIHRSHCIIFRTQEPPDVLKPTYYYGGIPLTQQIMERVYNAERTANEGPLLAMTKRLNIMKVDLAQALANPQGIQQRVNFATNMRDNNGFYVIDNEEELSQLDTSLADLDAVIMTQYQLVAAQSYVPSTKLMGTTPKGFNATGEYEEASYHEFLESMQAHDCTPFIDRHHELVIKSDIGPKFGIKNLKVQIEWHSLDAMTAKEKAEINEIEARRSIHLVDSGAIDGQDVRDKLIKDNDSGYNGLSKEAPEMPENEDDGKFFESEGDGEKEEFDKE